MNKKVVAKDGTGDYASITEAINDLRELDDIHLLIKDGIYREKIGIEKKNIFLEGESRDGTILEFGDGAFHPHLDGKPFGTFRSYTLYLYGEKVHLRHLTVKNTAGIGEINGQGIALYLDALLFDVFDVALYGHQDTLFMAPLPKEPRAKGSFIGPGEHRERRSSTGIIRESSIVGDVDFIFGGANVLFEHCDIESLDHGKNEVNYIAAPCTRKEEVGFIFKNSRFLSESRRKMTYLARPWREFAKVAFIECEFNEHLLPGAFDPWGEESHKKTTEFNLDPANYFKKDELNFGNILFREEIMVYDSIVNKIKTELMKGWE
ncbi:MAG: pectinesterase family protein [Clostridiaceae bacterium]